MGTKINFSSGFIYQGYLLLLFLVLKCWLINSVGKILMSMQRENIKCDQIKCIKK
jgi:hypothetical protein